MKRQNGTSSGHIDRNRQPYCSDILIFRIFHDLHFELLKGSPRKKYWMSTPAIYQRHGKGIKALDVLTRFPKLGCLQLSVSQAACFNHFHPKVSAVNSKSRKGRMGFGSGEGRTCIIQNDPKSWMPKFIGMAISTGKTMNDHGMDWGPKF